MKSYRKIIRSKKDQFFKRLNQNIRDGKLISWKDLKKIKKFTNSETKLDDDHLNTFQSFYQDLYSDNHSTMDNITKAALFDEANNLANSSTPNETLNTEFTMDEINAVIAGLQNGKASSFDHISNEIIKALDNNFKHLLLKLFNLCLTYGLYFWSESVMTPIHKKGSIYDPDNYRAIAVCSCIGKLLSTMLLRRLIIHRSASSPDPANQCGFTKGSQCNDHIFTLHTILGKYKRVKTKVYTAFIDLRKAFDLVCRQALLFKLACYGVNGGFYNILKAMYSNSTGHIKLNGKISKVFDIMKGTEQGHPLSPELFKVYFKDLSDQLNQAIANCPTLAGVKVTHLAWADDLVIFALDFNSLQTLLDIIVSYCNEWGLEININKTKYMVFNSNWNQQTSMDDHVPTINSLPLVRVTSYCYLGVTISSNGNFNNAIDSLCTKGLAALFSLRRTIDRRFVDAKCQDKLFDTLIKPILTYGCQIWLPVSPVIKSLTNPQTRNGDYSKLIGLFARQPYERLHLRHLKYMLGTNRRSSNAAAWGETGKFPLIISSIRLCVNYFKRIVSLPESSLTKAALTEQIHLNLPWFENIKKIIDCFDDVNPKDYNRYSNPTLNALLLADLCSSSAITKSLQDRFIQAWNVSLSNSSKLDFYRSIKSSFTWEHYLDNISNFNERRSVARLRCSAHKLNIETGRYTNIKRSDRLCGFCLTTNNIATIENENHILSDCPNGDEIRLSYLSSVRDILNNSTITQNCRADFNMAKTFPPDPDVFNSKDTISIRTKIIKLCCTTIHRLYDKAIKNKD